jgi:hypothetical protein
MCITCIWTYFMFQSFSYYQVHMHTLEKSAIPSADVDFGMWKTVHLPRLPQKWNVFSLIKICRFSYQKVSEISVKPKCLHKSSATYIAVLELFHIKIICVSFSHCCKHFTSLAYEILYARKVALLDKLKEVDFSQFFPCVQRSIGGKL